MNTDSQHLQQVSEEFQHMVEEFFLVQSRYSAAIKEIQTKLEILDDEFQMRHRRNPIHHMQSRLKTIQSMLEKLKRKNYEVSINSAVKNLQDIAGIRVICSYVQDVYTIANLLVSQDDVHLVRMADYIREPKPNGYRSLHLIVEIPVFSLRRADSCTRRGADSHDCHGLLGFAGAFAPLQGAGVHSAAHFRRIAARRDGHCIPRPADAGDSRSGGRAERRAQ